MFEALNVNYEVVTLLKLIKIIIQTESNRKPKTNNFKSKM